MPIYVNFEKPRTIKEFLIKFYAHTGYGCGAAATTYFDVNCKKVQCRKTYRSFDDLFEIITTYYPSTTPKILLFNLLTLNITNPKTGEPFLPHLGTCSGMQRNRYIPYPTWNGWGEYVTRRMPQSKYSWKELLLLLDIKTFEELKDFVQKNRK